MSYISHEPKRDFENLKNCISDLAVAIRSINNNYMIADGGYTYNSLDECRKMCEGAFGAINILLSSDFEKYIHINTQYRSPQVMQAGYMHPYQGYYPYPYVQNNANGSGSGVNINGVNNEQVQYNQNGNYNQRQNVNQVDKKYNTKEQVFESSKLNQNHENHENYNGDENSNIEAEDHSANIINNEIRENRRRTVSQQVISENKWEGDITYNDQDMGRRSSLTALSFPPSRSLSRVGNSIESSSRPSSRLENSGGSSPVHESENSTRQVDSIDQKEIQDQEYEQTQGQFEEKINGSSEPKIPKEPYNQIVKKNADESVSYDVKKVSITPNRQNTIKEFKKKENQKETQKDKNPYLWDVEVKFGMYRGFLHKEPLGEIILNQDNVSKLMNVQFYFRDPSKNDHGYDGLWKYKHQGKNYFLGLDKIIYDYDYENRQLKPVIKNGNIVRYRVVNRVVTKSNVKNA